MFHMQPKKYFSIDRLDFKKFQVNLPGGKPHFDIKSTIIDVARGVFSLGLITQVHPVARIGPSLYPRLSSGKFHVRIQTTTPTGECFV